jgi:RNA polymerase sigma factor (sigma-70 family)
MSEEYRLTRLIDCPSGQSIALCRPKFRSAEAGARRICRASVVAFAAMTASEWQISDSTTELQRLSNALFQYFRRRIPDHEDIGDYVAQVWIAAGKSFRGECSLHHYVFQIARRVVSDYWRRASRRPCLVEEEVDFDGDLPIDAPGCETALEALEQREAMASAMELVDPVYREALRMWAEGRDAMQVATVLGVPYNTARSRIARGRRQLLELMKQKP